MGVKAKKLDPHAILKGAQRDASDPAEHVWLSASAGTGKTYVLSARVLRLLLRGVKPDTILCLTFTKAGAAEMAERVHARLAHWVQIKDTELAAELRALDENFGPEHVAAARTLFATVLEARSGGLRIMTIHAFCQTLLAGFPLEAGIAPGFRPLEGREEATLVATVLAELVIKAEREGETRLLGDLQTLSLRLGEADALKFLKRASAAAPALEDLGPGLAAIVRQALNVPTDYRAADDVAACADGAFDRAALLALSQSYAAWGTKTGDAAVNTISDWLLGTPEERARELSTMLFVWRTKTSGFRKNGPKGASFQPLVEQLDLWCSELVARAARADLAENISAALSAAQRYARAYADAKRVRGLVDFDDQIQLTRALLMEPGIGDWIRFKLDQATDHILVDESQDTNRAQWDIVDALAAEFWAGDGAKPDKLRTIFAVGDFKQAIYGFQGTDPQYYNAAGRDFAEKALYSGQRLLPLSLDQSFRSSPPVLQVVDSMLTELGADALGLPTALVAHTSFVGGPGKVLLFAPVTTDSNNSDADNSPSDDDADGESGGVSDATRELATKLAKQVKAWLDEPVWLAGQGRALMPGDVMILVRRRSEIAALLVARLHEEGVTVAGVDRLRLGAPIAVQDLLAAMRFAAQPHDDLNLANLLVSPLIGWSQDDLFGAGYGRAGLLWDAVPAGASRDELRNMLSAADNILPYAFLENLLSGALQGRKKLLARLGEEARDPIDELLNAALQYEREGIASLQQFIDWFDRGETEVVRDSGAAGNAVRVMTVHGAKGLEAPFVILADACSDPDKAHDQNFKWDLGDALGELPIPKPRSAERALVASLEQAMEKADDKARKEHWRLLYVAMTRAREYLVIAGSLSPSVAKRGVPTDSWHAAIERAMVRLDAADHQWPAWGRVLQYGDSESPAERAARAAIRPVDHNVAATATPKPAWLDQPAPQEARPPRPLAPSSIGETEVANPPPSASMAVAAKRGQLLHALFERLPVLPPADRREAGAQWLAAEDADAGLVDIALNIIDDARFATIFAADALAEVPIAGVVDGIVIAGTVDRLSVSDTRVEIIDFKTGRRPPSSVNDAPVQHLRQMAAYAAVLGGVFPDREICVSLLYTEGPLLLRLPPEVLALHKPSFAAAQDNLATAS